MRWIAISLALGGCMSAGALERSSLRHDERAEALARHGDGQGAAREANQAVADREEALRRFAKRGYWESEVLMR